MKRKSHILMLVLFWIFISSVTAKGELLQLTKGSLNGVQPDISNGQVVWSGYDGHDYEIYVWDGATVKKLTDNEYDDDHPTTDNGYISWEGQKNGN